MKLRGSTVDTRGARQRPFVFSPANVSRFLFVSLLSASCSSAEPPGSQAEGRRIAPSSAVTCDRNLLTSYFGLVSGYRREAAQTWLQISTDYDTVEEVTIDHPDNPDASARYRLWGEPFRESDWAAIETAPGVIIAGMRVTAWICDDGQTPPLVDWQPPPD